jgi:hypothetical protein
MRILPAILITIILTGCEERIQSNATIGDIYESLNQYHVIRTSEINKQEIQQPIVTYNDSPANFVSEASYITDYEVTDEQGKVIPQPPSISPYFLSDPKLINNVATWSFIKHTKDGYKTVSAMKIEYDGSSFIVDIPNEIGLDFVKWHFQNVPNNGFQKNGSP